MTGTDRDSPEYWRERAQEARARAKQLSDDDARRMMRDIAATYDKLAERAEKKLRDAGM